MDPIVREQVRRWKTAMDLDNEIVLQEKRKRSPEERFRLLETFLAGHARYRRRAPSVEKHALDYREVQGRLSGRREQGH